MNSFSSLVFRFVLLINDDAFRLEDQFKWNGKIISRGSPELSFIFFIRFCASKGNFSPSVQFEVSNIAKALRKIGMGIVGGREIKGKG